MILQKNGTLFDSLKKPRLFQDQISVVLIGGAFILIAFILGIHFYSSSIIIIQFNSSTPPPTSEERVDFFGEINTSNLNLFSVILTLFGAWIGAVLAFYFGSQSLDKAYTSLRQAQESINNLVSDTGLAGVKVSEIITKNPDSLKLLKAKPTDKIKDIVRNAKDRNYKHVMTTDESEQKVLGLLFISDLLKIKSESDLLEFGETLEKFIEANEVIDDITKIRWTKQGINNYVTANMDDSVKNVVDKMKGLGDSLSIRAVVMEKGLPHAIITYDMISKELKK
jgi:hypothetical protein